MVRMKKMKARRPSLLALSAAALCAALVLGGCSGTGTMYTPESEESASLEDTSADEFAADSPGHDGHDSREEGKKDPRGRGPAAHAPGEEPEEPRTRSVVLEGTGSDLFTAETVDYYYSFTLESTGFRLPCSFQDLSRAGWELAPAEDEEKSAEERVVPHYSYEFFDAVPSGEEGGLFSGNSGKQKKIRLCLANFSETDLPPQSCLVCGISVSADSGLAFLTAFKEGIGSSLGDLVSVFDDDPSVCSITSYEDGSRTLQYRFSNGLTEGQKISVLAEAEEKSLSELMIAQTGRDGSTIDKLSLFYFRMQ